MIGGKLRTACDPPVTESAAASASQLLQCSPPSAVNNFNDSKTSVNNTCDDQVSLPLQSQSGGNASTAAVKRRDPSPPKLSYSVNFFNWSVSDCSSDEDNDCKNVTMSLNRLKIRKSSKERNEKARNGNLPL